MSNWQPIETAPTNGTKVLICQGKDVFAAHYDEKFDCVFYDYDDDNDELIYTFRGAWTDGAVLSFRDEETKEYQPTHWQPLPAPPNE